MPVSLSDHPHDLIILVVYPDKSTLYGKPEVAQGALSQTRILQDFSSAIIATSIRLLQARLNDMGSKDCYVEASTETVC